jgi:predicted transcriptional regulator
MKKSKITTSKPASETKAEQSAVTEGAKITSQKTSKVQKSSEKAQAVAPKPVAAMSERVGLTAGRIWHYLAKNGASSVSKLVRELPEEEEKVIQRSIGWLAQEGKITLKSIDRVETIALKD